MKNGIELIADWNPEYDQKHMNVYKFEYKSGEKEWVCAQSKKEAKEHYLSETGCGDLNGFYVTKVPKKELATLVIIDPEKYEPEPEERDDSYSKEDYRDGYKVFMTFEDRIKNCVCPEIIATTEY